MLRIDAHEKEKVIEPMLQADKRFWAVVIILLALVGWGIYTYIQQLRLGLGETGMQRPVYWGIYMTNFVFFIGLSLSGTFISAILRITGAEWRRPITRIAEAVTVFALIIATIQIIIDMGRPDRLYYVVLYGRLQSPILWDVFIVNLYLLSSSAYLYMPLIPDLAILRDNMPDDAPQWRHILYRTLALGWRGNVEQWRRLEKAISIIAICIIPIAVFVHTITSWLLATTVQPGWHSTVFGPYFVVTAIFSGIAGLFLVMTTARWALGLEEYITLRQYHNLGLLFVTMGAIWGYFTYTESLILAAGQQTMEFPVLASKLWGQYAVTFWLMIGLIALAFWVMAVPLILPSFARRVPALQPRYAFGFSFASAGLFFLLDQETVPAESQQEMTWILILLAVLAALIGISIWAKQHPISAAVIAGVCVVAGTWLERWNIIIPTATHPRLIYYSSYTPTSTEIILSISSVALFVLALTVFFKLFPAIPIWEVEEGKIIEKAQAGVEIPLPEPSEPLGKKRRWRFQ